MAEGGESVGLAERNRAHPVPLGKRLGRRERAPSAPSTTYYTLVGLHALHVTGGVTLMLIVLSLALGRQVTSANPSAVGLVSWYWHFVDGVWVVVFTVVYLIGR